MVLKYHVYFHILCCLMDNGYRTNYMYLLLPAAATSLRAGFQVYLSKLWVVDVTKEVRYDLLIIYRLPRLPCSPHILCKYIVFTPVCMWKKHGKKLVEPISGGRIYYAINYQKNYQKKKEEWKKNLRMYSDDFFELVSLLSPFFQGRSDKIKYN